MAIISREERKRTATIREEQDHTKRYRFPIPDKIHARNALAQLNKAKGLSAEERARIVRKAFRVLGWPDREHPETAAEWLRKH